METLKQEIFDKLKAAGLFTKEKYHEDPAKEKLAKEVLSTCFDKAFDLGAKHITDPDEIAAYKAKFASKELAPVEAH